MTQQMWDDRYAAGDRVWSGNPNPMLVEVAAGLTPGSAVDLGCGEGADAIWLARSGWAVTGVDFSAAGLARASAEAERAGVDVDWVRTDLADWRPDRRYDLVAVHFFHGDPIVRAHLHRAAWQATAGTLVIVGHDVTHPGSPTPEVRYGVADILAALGLADDSPEVLVAEVRTRGDAVDAVVIARR